MSFSLLYIHKQKEVGRHLVEVFSEDFHTSLSRIKSAGPENSGSLRSFFTFFSPWVSLDIKISSQLFTQCTVRMTGGNNQHKIQLTKAKTPLGGNFID